LRKRSSNDSDQPDRRALGRRALVRNGSYRGTVLGRDRDCCASLIRQLSCEARARARIAAPSCVVAHASASPCLYTNQRVRRRHVSGSNSLGERRRPRSAIAKAALEESLASDILQPASARRTQLRAYDAPGLLFCRASRLVARTADRRGTP